MKTKNILLTLTASFLFLPIISGCSSSQPTGDNEEQHEQETQQVLITVVGGSGSGSYNVGDTVTVVAETPTGKNFKGWELDSVLVSTNSTFSFRAIQDITITALYENKVETITVTNGTGGGSYEYGSECTVTATVPQDYAFTNWTSGGNIVSTSNPYTFTVTESLNLTANFVKDYATVTVINGEGSGKYKIGTNVTITANSVTDFEFKDWTINGKEVSTSNPYTFKLTDDVTLTANFVKAYATLTVINGEGSGKYRIGSEVTVTATETTGLEFKEWTVDSKQVSTENPYTFTLNDDLTIKAEMSTIEVPVTSTKVIAISDVHVIPTDNTPGEHLRKTLQYAKTNGVEVIIFNGDSISYGTQESYDLLDGIINDVYGSVNKEDRPEFLFNMGNHEFYANSSCRHQDTDYDREVGSFRTFANKWMSSPIEDNVYYRLINGVNYIMACPGKEEKDGNYYLAANGAYSDNDIAKLKAALDLASGNGNPIVLGTHHPWGYTYGGKSYRVPGEPLLTKMRTLLANYPNIINLTSHSHFSSLHERTFDQTNYTTINIGTHCYNKAVGGQEFDENNQLIEYLNVSDNKYTDAISKSQDGLTHFGIGLDFGNESVVAKRINFAKGQDYEHGTWTIPYGITKENMHDKFYYEAGERVGETLTFTSGTTLEADVEVGASSSSIEVTFEDVEQYYAVEGYKVEIKGSTGQVDKTAWWQSMFWADLGKKSMYSFTLDNVKLDSEYTVSVYPMDFFGKYGAPISKTLTTSATRTDEEQLEIDSGDLLYSLDVASSSFTKVGPTYFMDKKCMDVSNASSGYSLKLSCNEEGEGWPTIKFDLGKTYDFTKLSVTIDTKFENTHKWFSIKGYDESGTLVLKDTGYDAPTTAWSNAVIGAKNFKEHVADGKSITAIRYIEFVVNFDKFKGQNQAVYLDNFFIEDTSGEIDYDTYNGSTTITFDEVITNWQTSTKHLKFYTKTTTQFMFTLVNGGDRLTSKVYITIGDGSSPSVSGVSAGGYTITKNGSNYLIDIVVGSIGVNAEYSSIADAKAINFREGFPLTVGQLVVE